MSRARTLIKLSLMLFIVQPSSCTWKPNKHEKETLCKTEECKTRGKEYKNNMDTRVHPCQDFYTFTCGNWHKNNPGPKYAPEWTVLNVMNSDVTQIIRQILESYNFQLGENILFRRAKEVYETCIKIPVYSKRNASEIAQEIVKIGRVPTTSLWDAHLKYLKLSGESAFFGIRILSNRATEDIPVLIFLEPPSAYGSIFHEEVWKPQEEHAYTEFLFLIMKSLEINKSDALVKERVEKVLEFRKRLDRVIQRNRVKRAEFFNPLLGWQLDQWFANNLQGQTETQNISWTEIIEVLLQNLSLHTRQTRKIVAMRQKEYFLDLVDLLKNVPEEVLGNHVEIYFVERHLKLKENMFKLLEATSIEPHGLLRYVREKYYPRWQTCIEEHNMKETLEKLLFDKWFMKESTEIVHQLTDNIKIAIENQMKKSKWLDQITREKTMGKLNQLEEWIGFPPWINGFATPRERDRQEILTPNAWYSISHNLLYVHAPLLLPPVFSPTLPAVYNYGGIGTNLGHELYHSIDDCGGYQHGNRKIIWWSPGMRTKCLSKKIDFIEMYNQITDIEYKNRYNTDVKSDTTGSFLEDLPDVMGLEAAYNAYKELVNNETSACQVLPHFEKYSCDQMFYIAFANTFCGYYTNKAAKTKLEISAHSIDSVRVNAAVAQMDSFGRAFRCPVGFPLNPHEKLNLWQ